MRRLKPVCKNPSVLCFYFEKEFLISSISINTVFNLETQHSPFDHLLSRKARVNTYQSRRGWRGSFWWADAWSPPCTCRVRRQQLWYPSAAAWPGSRPRPDWPSSQAPSRPPSALPTPRASCRNCLMEEGQEMRPSSCGDRRTRAGLRCARQPVISRKWLGNKSKTWRVSLRAKLHPGLMQHRRWLTREHPCNISLFLLYLRLRCIRSDFKGKQFLFLSLFFLFLFLF